MQANWHKLLKDRFGVKLTAADFAIWEENLKARPGFPKAMNGADRDAETCAAITHGSKHCPQEKGTPTYRIVQRWIEHYRQIRDLRREIREQHEAGADNTALWEIICRPVHGQDSSILHEYVRQLRPGFERPPVRAVPVRDLIRGIGSGGPGADVEHRQAVQKQKARAHAMLDNRRTGEGEKCQP